MKKGILTNNKQNSNLNKMIFTPKNMQSQNILEKYNQKYVMINSRNKLLKNGIYYNDFDYLKKKNNNKVNNIKKNVASEQNIIIYNNISTKKYIKTLNLLYNNQIEAINTQFINYKNYPKYSNKNKSVYDSPSNSPYKYYINSKEKEKRQNNSIYSSSNDFKKKKVVTPNKKKKQKKNYSSLNIKKNLINIEFNNNIKEFKKKISKIFEIFTQKSIIYKKCFFNNMINYTKNIYEYDIDYINSLIKEKKEYEEIIEQLNKENQILKENIKEIQQKEEIYNKIRQDNENLNILNNKLIIENEKFMNDLKSLNEKYEQLLKEKNKSTNNINLNSDEKIGIINDIANDPIQEINDTNISPKNINENYKEKKYNNSKEIIFTDKDIIKKNLKNAIIKKIDEMKYFMQKKFAKFYYNGIFLQMTGKLNHLNDKPDNIENQNNNINSNTDSNIDNNNYNNNKNKEEEKRKKENDDLKQRLKKSRSLRRLLNRKAKEKKEMLKNYFFKFYRNGIISKFRNERKRKTMQVNSIMSNRLIQKLILDKNGGKKELHLDIK